MANGMGPRGRRAVRVRQSRRDRFLAHFAANCNVTAAAAAAEVGITTIWQWRRDDADFAQAWEEALGMGYQLLEARLVAHALGDAAGCTLEGIEPIAAAPIDVDLAIRLMAIHRSVVAKGRSGRPLKPVKREDMLKVLLDRIDLIEKRKRLAAAREAAALTIEHRQEAGA